MVCAEAFESNLEIFVLDVLPNPEFLSSVEKILMSSCFFLRRLPILMLMKKRCFRSVGCSLMHISWR